MTSSFPLTRGISTFPCRCHIGFSGMNCPRCNIPESEVTVPMIYTVRLIISIILKHLSRDKSLPSLEPGLQVAMIIPAVRGRNIPFVLYCTSLEIELTTEEFTSLQHKYECVRGGGGEEERWGLSCPTSGLVGLCLMRSMRMRSIRVPFLIARNSIIMKNRFVSQITQEGLHGESTHIAVADVKTPH